MRYVFASLVALLLSATIFVYHWWVSLALEDAAGKLPPDAQMKLPKHLDEMLSWDDLLYRNCFIFIAVFFVVCLGVAWRTRKRLEVR